MFKGGKKIEPSKRKKRIPKFIDKGKRIRWEVMVEADVSRYFKSMIPKGHNAGSCYCERRGILIGPRRIQEWPNTYIITNESGFGIPFDLCDPCYQDKESGRPEAVPDIEDIVRYNVRF